MPDGADLHAQPLALRGRRVPGRLELHLARPLPAERRRPAGPHLRLGSLQPVGRGRAAVGAAPAAVGRGDARRPPVRDRDVRAPRLGRLRGVEPGRPERVRRSKRVSRSGEPGRAGEVRGALPRVRPRLRHRAVPRRRRQRGGGDDVRRSDRHAGRGPLRGGAERVHPDRGRRARRAPVPVRQGQPGPERRDLRLRPRRSHEPHPARRGLGRRPGARLARRRRVRPTPRAQGGEPDGPAADPPLPGDRPDPDHRGPGDHLAGPPLHHARRDRRAGRRGAGDLGWGRCGRGAVHAGVLGGRTGRPGRDGPGPARDRRVRLRRGRHRSARRHPGRAAR